MPHPAQRPVVGLGQLWRAPDGQHYAVVGVSMDRVAFHRATAAGRVLDTGCALNEPVEHVKAEWVFVEA